MKIKQWYKDNYKDDEYIYNSLNDESTFKQLYITLLEGGSAIEVIFNYYTCSIVRERIFERLADILNVEYNHIYDLYMNEKNIFTS